MVLAAVRSLESIVAILNMNDRLDVTSLPFSGSKFVGLPLMPLAVQSLSVDRPND